MAKLGRFPKVLADELSAALFAVRDLGHEQTMDLLARYRRNRAKRIATWGVLSVGAPVDGLESIPCEHHWKIERLDDAFQKLHHYRDGGAGDYVATDVEREINRHRGKQPKRRDNAYEDICDYLRRKGYETSENKKELVADAVLHFDVSESTIRRAIKKGGLARQKRTTVT